LGSIRKGKDPPSPPWIQKGHSSYHPAPPPSTPHLTPTSPEPEDSFKKSIRDILSSYVYKLYSIIEVLLEGGPAKRLDSTPKVRQIVENSTGSNEATKMLGLSGLASLDKRREKRES
jgi:hypothetical protein